MQLGSYTSARQRDQAYSQLRENTAAAQASPSLDVTTFDLQKSLPTPLISTNIVRCEGLILLLYMACCLFRAHVTRVKIRRACSLINVGIEYMGRNGGKRRA